MKIKCRILPFILLCLTAFCLYSCENDNSYETITLSCISGDTDFDNQTGHISLTVHNDPVSMSISGGDGHYTVQNNSPSVVSSVLAENVVTLTSVAIGEAVITIKDGSNIAYDLHIDIVPNPYHVSSYALVIGENMKNDDIAELEGKIIFDAPKGVWKITAFDTKTGKARLYFSESNASEYKEYTYTANGAILPDVQQPILFGSQIEAWLTMKSDDEDLTLFIITQPTTLNGVLIRGNSLVRDVTQRYRSAYPKLERAYEIQNYK